jgi:hypothetical protein
VVRISEGEVRWMEVRDWLKRASDNGRKLVKQIVFAGERFDVMSGLRLAGATQPRSGRAPKNPPSARRWHRALARLENRPVKPVPVCGASGIRELPHAPGCRHRAQRQPTAFRRAQHAINPAKLARDRQPETLLGQQFRVALALQPRRLGNARRDGSVPAHGHRQRILAAPNSIRPKADRTPGG